MSIPQFQLGMIITGTTVSQESGRGMRGVVEYNHLKKNTFPPPKKKYPFSLDPHIIEKLTSYNE